MQEILVGCAGWAIPRQHRHLMEARDSALASYATRFSIVEINSSFYRSHRVETYARWSASVPGHFRFSVKIPKLISHELALRGCGSALNAFVNEISGLEDKLGRVLLQLPPSQRFDMRSASAFFRMWHRRSDVPLVCEPRHASWFSPAAEELFHRHGVSRVSADPRPVDTADTSRYTARWPYWRLHGAPRMYYSPYSEESLREFAEAAAAFRTPSPWIIFDNTAHSFAVANAARLQDLLRPEGGNTPATTAAA